MTLPNPVNYSLAAELIATGQWRVDPEVGLVYGKKRQAFRRVNSWGYVQIKFRDPSNWRVEHNALAHRVIWESVHGPLAHGLTINHLNGAKTDNRLVNLEAVTIAENVQHAWDTGLQRAGVDHPHAKLTAAAVLDIYQRAWAGERHRSIAALHGTDHGTVSRIKHGHHWRSVTNHNRVA